MRSVSVPRAVTMITATSRSRAQDAADVAAVAVGEREVEQDEVGLGARARASSASAAVRATTVLEPLARAAGGANGSAIDASSSTIRIRVGTGSEGSRPPRGRAQALPRLDPRFHGRLRGARPMLPGMSLNRTAIAAAGTLLALAVLALFALRAGGAEPPHHGRRHGAGSPRCGGRSCAAPCTSGATAAAARDDAARAAAARRRARRGRSRRPPAPAAGECAGRGGRRRSPASTVTARRGRGGDDDGFDDHGGDDRFDDHGGGDDDDSGHGGGDDRSGHGGGGHDSAPAACSSPPARAPSFLVVLTLFALQVRAGADPAIGQGRRAAAARRARWWCAA